MKELVSAKEYSLKPRHECGICGIFGRQDAAKLTYFGLYALQHRGQESAGIVASDGSKVVIHKDIGLVCDVFSERTLQRLSGHLAIGHVRYSTTGASNIINTQPFMVTYKGSSFCVAHNGNLVNAIALRQELERQGSIFQTTMDSEIIIHLFIRNFEYGLQEAIKMTFARIRGAYSLLLMTQDTIIAVRDPNGFRPLCLGILENGAHVVASETCALDLIEAKYLREVEPGEVLIINERGIISLYPWESAQKRYCIFELVYFSRPDSEVFGVNVYETRKRMGEILAREANLDGDFVIPFPDSGNYAAIGYAHASGIPLELGMIRNHYVGRTFIQPTQSMRDFSVKVKLNPVRSLFKGKRVIVVEDSIIRGTTARSRIQTLRRAGAKEIHMVVSCPPTRHACYYGIDFPTDSQLIAADRTVNEVCTFIGLDSLTYLSLKGMIEATGLCQDHFCLACYTGNYIIEPGESLGKDALGKSY